MKRLQNIALFTASLLFASCCTAPVFAEDSEIPTYPVFGNHTDYNDPLFNEYIWSAEVPVGIDCYFTGQICLAGENTYSDAPNSGINEYGHLLMHWKDRTLDSVYTEWGYCTYLYCEDAPLTVAEAQELCAEILSEVGEEANPQLVFCKKMPCTVSGDLTGDDQVDTRDAKYLLDWSVMWMSFNSDRLPLLHSLPTADVNGDGVADSIDAKCILNYSVYQLAFGEAPEWSEVLHL